MHERILTGRTISKCAAQVVLMTLATASLMTGVSPLRPAAQAAHRPADATPDIADLTTKLTDLEVTVHVDRSDPKELEKIGKDFARTYALRDADDAL